MKKKVTLKTLYATPQRVVQPGQTVEMPRKEADALVKSGAAVEASRDPAARTATQPSPPEDHTQPPEDTGDGEKAADTEAESGDSDGDDGGTEAVLRAELTSLDRDQLVERAKTAGVKANGRSAAIIDRIVDAELAAGDDAWTDDA